MLEDHIGHYQSHAGADIKIYWAILGSVLINIKAILGPTSKSYWAKTKVIMVLGTQERVILLSWVNKIILGSASRL